MDLVKVPSIRLQMADGKFLEQRINASQGELLRTHTVIQNMSNKKRQINLSLFISEDNSQHIHKI